MARSIGLMWTPPSSNQLLAASTNGRYLVNASGAAVFVNGEAAWSAIVNLTAAEQAAYLDDCQARGINAVMVSLIEHKFSGQSPAWRDRAGNLPFSGTAFQSSTVSAYFTAALAFVRLAAARGIYVWLAPYYLGFGGLDEGWQVDGEAASNAQMQSWGSFCGTTFGGEPNIVWQLFGDYDPASHARTNAVRTGIASTDTSHTIYTAHLAPESVSTNSPESWMTLNYVYRTGGYVHDYVDTAWQASPTIPAFLGEAWYEQENGASSLDVRRQAWGAFLAGACGHFYGHRDIWGFGAGLFQSGTWQAAVANTGNVAPARQQMKVLRDFVAAIPSWHLGAPDRTSTFVTSARGTGANYLVARFCTLWGCVYVANGSGSGAITIDKSEMGGAFTWGWFNPRSGGALTGGASGVAASGTMNVTAPDGNDWILYLKKD